ncbi:MAG TPA: DUF488 domain-containing protein [Candidatus Baltobacteraceae bacterium]|nr:DUF488 domain-containing protein [Candidatus Baltobacteraceae bacterium]
MAAGLDLYTIGHGTAPIEEFIGWLRASDIHSLVDVRRYAGSRHNPQYGSNALAESLGAVGITYRNDVQLGGRRKPSPDSENTGLRNEAFRAYADYMETDPFHAAFQVLLSEAEQTQTVVMCSETVWWRCHRRLIADAVLLIAERPVKHIVSGKVGPHILTEGVRREGSRLRYGIGPLSV